MGSQDERPGRFAVNGPPAIVAVSAFVLYLLPNEVLIFLVAWTVASFPIGVLIGHCVLSEE